MPPVSDLLFRLGADPSGLLSGLAAAQSAMRAAATRMQGAMSPVKSAVEQATAGMQRFSGVLGGLSVAAAAAGLSRTINQIADLDDAAEKTGASVEALSSLLNTLGPTGVSLDTITTAMSRLNKAMNNADDETKGAGEAFQVLGIKTRDAAGNLRPTETVLEEVARKLSEYKDSANKTALAVAIFGKSGAELLPMLKDLASTTREAGTVTGDQAAAAEKAANALRKLGVEMTNMQQALTNALIPSLNDFLGKLRSIASISGNPLKWGKYLFGDASDIDGEVDRIQAEVVKLEAMRARVRALPMGQQDAAGVGDIDVQLGLYARQLQEAKAVQRAQQGLGVSGVSRPVSPFSDARFKGPGDAPKLSGDGGSGAASAAAALAQRQRTALEQLGMQIAKEQELSEVEQMRLRTTTGAYRDFSATVKQRLMAGAAEIDQIKALEAKIKEAGEAEKADVEALKVLKVQALADIKSQNDELDRAAQKWRELVDPTYKYVQQLEQIRALVSSGRLTKDQGMAAEFDVQIGMQAELEKGLKPAAEPAWLGTMQGGFTRLFESIKDGSISAQGVMQGAFGMMGNIVTGVLSKLATEWVASMVVGKLAAIQTAFSDISASAARAGAAAFASTAAIPIVGPGLAPEAGAAAYGGAMSFASGLIASASGGYDIPAGVNPMTQLHAREMVLPADIAQPMREQLAGGGGMGGGVHVNISSPDARGVERLLMDNPGAVRRGLRSAFPSAARRAGMRF